MNALALVLADFVDSADVRVVERRSRARFPLEAGQRLLIAGHFLGQKLERYHAAELGVLGLVHHAHASAAQLADDTIVGKRAADSNPSPMECGRNSRTGGESESTCRESGDRMIGSSGDLIRDFPRNRTHAEQIVVGHLD